MARCEDYPCCGHELGDCDGSLYGSDDSIRQSVEEAWRTGHGYCEHEYGVFNCEDGYYEEEDEDYDDEEEGIHSCLPSLGEVCGDCHRCNWGELDNPSIL